MKLQCIFIILVITFCYKFESSESTPIEIFLRIPTEHYNKKNVNGFLYTVLGEGKCTVTLETTSTDIKYIDDIGTMRSVSPGKEYSFSFKRKDKSANPPDITVKVKAACINNENEESFFEREVIIYGSKKTPRHFENRIKYSSIVSKNQGKIGPNIKRYSGAASCTVTEPFTAFSKTRNVNGRKSYRNFQIDVSGFREDTLLQFLVFCQDKNFPELTHEYCLPVLVLCTDDDIPDLSIRFYQFYNYNKNFPFYISGDTNGYTCQYSVSGRPDVTYVGLATNSYKQLNGFFLTNPSLPMTFDVTFNGQCSKPGSIDLNYKYHFANKDDDIVDGDPHFSQMIFDDESKQYKRICYDVTGEAGQRINIINLKNDTIKVYGTLLDDYYMHEIDVYVMRNLFQVTTNNIFLNKKLIFSWSKPKNITFDGNKINIYGNQIFLNIKNQNINIDISKGKSITEYLNINVKSQNVFKEENSGLIGFVGKRKYKIYQSSQNDVNLVTVFVDHFMKFGSIKERDSKECILMKVKDLIYPEKINYFIK